MDDPWDVKSVRKSGQYTSCMKINGVPLLPPVLSKECRSEMQYYRLLAKEVEKRISILQPYLENDTDSVDDITDAPEITDCVQEYGENEIGSNTSHNITKITDVDIHEELTTSNPLDTELYDLTSSKVVVESSITAPHTSLDYSLNVNETCSNINENRNNSAPHVLDLPERDYNCVKSTDLLTDVGLKNIKCKQQQDTIIEEIVHFSFSIARDRSRESYLQTSLSQECPQSLSSKSFTGSLNNIHMQSESNDHVRPLVRQHSYTILNPSPQLLAHLEVQSLNLGVDMSCISMSESLTNLSTPGKKRRNWDLESAKAKWSNMAMELKQKNFTRANTRRPVVRGPTQRAVSPSRAKCVAAARTKYSTLSLKHTMKSEHAPKTRPNSPPRTRTSSPGRTRTSSPVRDTTSSDTITLEPPMSLKCSNETKSNNAIKQIVSPKTPICRKGPQEFPKAAKESTKTNQNNQPQKTVAIQPQKLSESNNCPKENGVNKSGIPKPISILEADDPAVRVRELYEKIQNQQKIQMTSLMEKQKREQMLLQQAFEEQNNLLFKQLKTICPKSPEKAKEAWGDKMDEADRGPVSLSQLINSKSPQQPCSPVSILTESDSYINHCDIVLKKSRDITDSIKAIGKSCQNVAKISAKVNLEGSVTRTNSPNSPIRKNTSTSRRLHYDTSGSERDYDLMLTDRTNDTLADLNVTFPSDSEDIRLSLKMGPEVTVIDKDTPIRSTDSAIKCMEQTIQRSINSCSARVRNIVNCQPTARQQAAARKIVAHAKGYLVRRLMQTARVQSTVQTIKDALLCALQLHQDREGIRGADVDLHRRLIQQITAACYSLHDTFITSTSAERCAMIAADRSRRASLAARPAAPKHRHSDVMSQSHTGAFLPRQKRVSAPPASLMTQSNYETYSSEKGRARYMPSPRRRPWR